MFIAPDPVCEAPSETVIRKESRPTLRVVDDGNLECGRLVAEHGLCEKRHECDILDDRVSDTTTRISQYQGITQIDAKDVRVRLLIDGETFTVVSSRDRVDVEYGETNTPADLVIRTDYVGFLDVGEGRISLEEFTAEHLEVVDGPEHMATFAALMSAAVDANV